MKIFSHVLLILLIFFGQGLAQDRKLPEHVRISPELSDSKFQNAIRIFTTDTIALRAWLQSTGKAIVVQNQGKGIYGLSGFSESLMDEIKKFPSAIWIDQADRKPEEETISGIFDNTVNAVNTAHHFFPLNSGEGLVLSVKEKPFDTEDIDLRGRILLNDQFDEAATSHATAMATIAAGAGNSAEFAKGGGWKSLITTSDFSQLLPDAVGKLKNQRVSVQNHSYGVGPENYYGVESVAYDQQLIDFPEILHVFSAGNKGTSAPLTGNYAGLAGYANLTGQFKLSKNTLTVGSVDQFNKIAPLSSRGPAHDGRLKPELVAFGDAGSSESAAVVSGVALMIQDALKHRNGSLPDAALVKAILINSARDIGRNGPDFETGFGNVNAFGAMQTVNSGNIFSGSLNYAGEKLTFALPNLSSAGKLKITLVWNDPPAEPFTGRALINDLDLEISNAATGQSWLPWILDPDPANVDKPAFRGIDRLNNVEQISLEASPEGDFIVLVNAPNILRGPQKFYVVFTLEKEFQWTHPVSSSPLKSGEQNFLRWQWNEAPQKGILEVRYSGQQLWTRVSDEVQLDQEFIEWEPISAQGIVQFRMIAGNEEYLSDLTAFNSPERIVIGYDCFDEIFLKWKAIPTAQSYEVFGVGEKFLERVLATSDTFAIVNKSLPLSGYFTVLPVFSGINGARENSVFYKNQGAGCYFKSILPEKGLVASSDCSNGLAGKLNVSLGTTYKLKSLTLEKENPRGFQPLFTSGVPGENFTLTDSNPSHGFNNYRIRLITEDGKEILSNEAGFFAFCEEKPVLFPNPAVSGTELNILIDNDDIASIRIYDPFGRLLKGTEEVGIIRSFSLAGISAGVYQVVVQGISGSVFSNRLLIK